MRDVVGSPRRGGFRLRLGELATADGQVVSDGRRPALALAMRAARTRVEHRFAVEVYYEDTDFSGLVYHANYLKYFERAREHLLGRERLVRLFREEGLGFVVYKAELEFKEGAVFGDTLEIRTQVTLPSEFRAVFQQHVWRPGGAAPAVKGELHLVCIHNAERRLVRLPQYVIDAVRSGT